MWQEGLDMQRRTLGDAPRELSELPLDSIRPKRAENAELGLPGVFCSPIGEIDDCSIPSDKPACGGERRSVDADPIADRDKLLRRLARVLAAPAANVDAEFSVARASARRARSW
jgi:hypothetical protein